MKVPLLSAVIPTHDRPQQLRAAVASVLAQTTPPYEVIIVDDGSTPKVDARIFNDVSVPVRVIRNHEAQGVASARNAGVEVATGDFVAFLDDDDSWVPGKLEFAAGCLAKHPDADVLIHRTGYNPPTRADNPGCTPLQNPLRRMIRQQPPSPNGVVVRRSVHLGVRFDESFSGAEDIDYLIRLAKSGVQFVETVAVLAIVGDTTTSAIGIDERIQGRLSLLSRHPEILADRKAAAFFYVRLGHLQRLADMRPSAFRSFLKAGTYSPSSALVWKGFVHCLRSPPSH